MSTVSQSLSRQRLGSSDLEITGVGFGAWAIGGGSWSFGWGPQEDTASLGAMRRAVDLGINWIDTAAGDTVAAHEERISPAELQDYFATRPLTLAEIHAAPSRSRRRDRMRG